MPKTEVGMNYFKHLRNVIAEEVWIGLKEINSNGIWIWADGSSSDQGIVIDADDFADCARLKDDGNVWDIHCSNIFRTICQRDANPEASTKVSTTIEPVSSTDSETKFVPENLSSALKVSYHVSPVYSKTTAQHVSTALKVSTHLSSVVSNISTENPQTPTPTTKYTDTATSQTLYTQSNRITTISSPMGKSNCSKSSTNSCRCQKRTMANTSEDQEMQTLKVTDYIWLNKCALQPLIDSGMVDVANCPYECSPKGSLTSQEDMFACVRRP
ncbi:Hypothetical predicted protein [Mytilus galloprovincialis]|uniref:C-type lectin domain-containing protein n=1 Tax=Mytilus galloprovincialis TaxID=29158 RepID=A0A8B6FFE7_MYTGA|nr:Hypothetical predicted protein [Mytilus galloprovincialis]